MASRSDTDTYSTHSLHTPASAHMNAYGTSTYGNANYASNNNNNIADTHNSNHSRYGYSQMLYHEQQHQVLQGRSSPLHAGESEVLQGLYRQHHHYGSGGSVHQGHFVSAYQHHHHHHQQQQQQRHHPHGYLSMGDIAERDGVHDPNSQRYRGGFAEVEAGENGAVDYAADAMRSIGDDGASGARKKMVYYRVVRDAPVCTSRTTSALDWVRLNVGGRIFTTTLATLSSDPETVLAGIAAEVTASRLALQGRERRRYDLNATKGAIASTTNRGEGTAGSSSLVAGAGGGDAGETTSLRGAQGEQLCFGHLFHERGSSAHVTQNHSRHHTRDAGGNRNNSRSGGGGGGDDSGAALVATERHVDPVTHNAGGDSANASVSDDRHHQYASSGEPRNVTAVLNSTEVEGEVREQEHTGRSPREINSTSSNTSSSLTSSESDDGDDSQLESTGEHLQHAMRATGEAETEHCRGGEALTPASTGGFLPLDTDAHNTILIDLDPDYFAPILNYLRHRVVVVPRYLNSRGVLAVAEYLNVQGMVRQLAPARHRRRQLLFSWGSGGNGELGTQGFLDTPVPTPVQVTPFGVKVRTVALGANYSCALGDDGNVYSFGNGDWGQLGLGSPKELDAHPTDKSAVVVIPRRIPLFERHRAMHISAGYAFAMAITSDHHVYFWGNNNHGQSGLGPAMFDHHLKKIDEPKLVEPLEGKKIVQLGCGSFFSLALSADGSLYSWGLVECLGLGPPDEVRNRFARTSVLGESLSSERRHVILSPQLVQFPTSAGHHTSGAAATSSNSGSIFLSSPLGMNPHHHQQQQEQQQQQQQRIIRIHAGQWHSGAINAAGELFTWGVGYQGRLGHGTKDPAYVPTRVHGALEGHRVVDVACGSFHTVALTDTGAVFCWGDNASGQCGANVSRAEAVTLPFRVVGLEFIAGGVVRGISCGRQHTVVVVEGPQPGCERECCRLDYRGRPKRSHAQVYSFGESSRGGGGAGTGVVGQAQLAAVAAAVAAGTNSVGLRTANNSSTSVSASTTAAAAAGVGTSQYIRIQGLEALDVKGVVSGLHHTFAYAEEINLQPEGGGAVSGGDGGLAEEFGTDAMMMAYQNAAAVAGAAGGPYETHSLSNQSPYRY